MTTTEIDRTEANIAVPMQSLLEQGILTKTQFNVAAIVTLTERSDDDDLSTVPEFLQWAMMGAWLGGISTAVKWWIGDWLAFGEKAWGERYAQAAEATGLDIGTLQNYAYTCRQVMPSRRREALSFTAHYNVAKLDPEAQAKWLIHAERNGLRSKDLAAAIKEAGGQVPGGGRHEDTHEPHGGDDEPYIDSAAVVKAAQRVWKDAQRDGDAYRVPRDTFAVLATALGKGD